MNPIIEKVATQKGRSIESLIENVGIIMAASAMAAEDFFASNPDGVFSEHSKYARAAIRATLEHLKEKVSEGMIQPLDQQNNLNTETGRFNATVIVECILAQAIAELDA